MKLSVVILILSIFLFSNSCSQKSDQSFKEVSGSWLVPQNQVLDGGPGKDGIPSVDQPEFVPLSQIDYLKEEDLILGIQVDGEIRGYPHAILNWHEIVNDQISDNKFALTYCPLTGTGIGWNREIGNGITTEFGVSGLLYNTNLMPYDRATNSTWSQLRLGCVHGELVGRNSLNLSFLEVPWSIWKEAYPESKVMSDNTGFNRNYRSYPYGDYRTNNDFLIFPVSNEDDLRPQKERLLGVVIDNQVKVYPIRDLGNGTESPELIIDELNGRDLIIYRDGSKNIITAFRNIDPTQTYQLSDDPLPVIFEDGNGNKWDLFGNALSGPRMGETMHKPTSFVGYWFSWIAFYPDLDIFD